MIWQIIKKQCLLLWRNPQHLLLLLGLPILLIGILGIALQGVLDEETPEIRLKVALIEHEQEAVQVERFLQALEKVPLPEEAKAKLKMTAENLAPIEQLKDIFGGAVLNNSELEIVKPSAKAKILKDDNYTALIEVPAGFTYDLLEGILLEKDRLPSLTVYQNEASQLGTGIMDTILRQYEEQWRIGSFIGKNGLNEAELAMDEGAISGEITSINQQDPISSKGYYTIGMAVMNVIFIASTIGFYAFEEKKMHAFDRIILANVSRWTYFIGVFISSVLLALVQLLFIFGFSLAVFNVTWPDPLSFFTVTIVYSLAIGGMAVFLTAVSFRLNSQNLISFFSSVLVYILSLVGGSFFPIGDYSGFIQKLGNWTPNGAGMSAYLKILRGENIASIANHLTFLIAFSIFIVVIAAASFPKRGLSS